MDWELARLAQEQLFQGGAFLMTGKEEKNPMTIGWCQFGRVWNTPICTVFVRKSRHSYALLERDQMFTVSFALDGAMKKELGFCGTKSGRDVNKRDALGLAALESRTGGIGGLGGCAIHVECHVAFKLSMEGTLPALQENLRNQFYVPSEQAGDDGDPHVVYFGEIRSIYRT